MGRKNLPHSEIELSLASLPNIGYYYCIYDILEYAICIYKFIFAMLFQLA